jgi:glutaminyl-tRNA synthetase
MHTTPERNHFISQIIDQDIASGKHHTIITRFPPEPNGYLHIGHAKAICLNFELAARYQGKCFLRFDDTNPIKEESKYAQAIRDDITWLGFAWDGEVNYASDYFPQLFEFARQLIKQGDAYVDSSSATDIRATRGTLQEPGQASPFRERSVAENLDLFTRMHAGEFANGEQVLRAKIDMASPNINLRDPIIYRILHTPHQRTENQWCIYPMYDYAHPLCDALEGITHSLCTLEFQDHRPLYDWFLAHITLSTQPHQYEFARLNLSHTVTSKRKLKQLVDEQHVKGWDDPRLPTLQGMRQRGYPAQAIRLFCASIGISKSDSVIDMSLLEETVRDSLNHSAPRAMAVLNPLKVVIENLPDDIELTIPCHPQRPELGTRKLTLSRELYIEQDDFMEQAPKKFFRLAPGKEVRLRHAFILKCTDVIKDESGQITELRGTIDTDTLGKNPTDRKVKGVIHWVSVAHAKPAMIQLYDRLFNVANPGLEADFLPFLNPQSCTTDKQAWVEPSLADNNHRVFQFERLGYFNRLNEASALCFNRVVSLKDTWEKLK